MRTFPASILCLIGLSMVGFAPVRGEAQTAPMAGMSQEMEHVHAGPSTSLTLTVDGKATTLTVADLQAMPQTTVTVTTNTRRRMRLIRGFFWGICWRSMDFR